MLSSHIICVSAATAAPLGALGCADDRVSVVHNGIDVATLEQTAVASPQNMRASLGARGGELIVAYLGRIDRHKGVIDFLEAAKLYCEAGGTARFVLIGGPVGDANVDWAEISGAAAKSPLNQHVHFTGFVDRPTDALRACDILTLPSHAEGLPRSVLEAMALGKTVVATAVGGIPEILIDGEHGVIVPPSRPQDLAQAWMRLTLDPAERARLGAAAAARIRACFTQEACTAGVARILKQFIPR